VTRARLPVFLLAASLSLCPPSPAASARQAPPADLARQAPPAASAQAPDWRAAALASFDEVWRTINDTFPDPAFGGVDWAAVRTELRPRAQASGSADAARDVIRDMLARLHRSHFVLLSASAASNEGLPGEATVPIEIRVAPAGVVVTRVTAGSTAEQAGVRPGALVAAIDGQPVSAWIASAQGADERARNLDVWRKAYRALHGVFGSAAVLDLRAPDGAARTVRVARAAEAGEVVQFGNLPALHVAVNVREARTPARGRAGVIAFGFWMTSINGAVDAAVDRFRQSDGLIFDLRGNPGGLALMMTGVAGHVLSTAAVLGRMQTRETADHPLTFAANPRLATADGRRVTPFAGPVAILVDELTASTSECFAGGLQSLGRARIFGRRSAGQALPASTKQLPNGDALMYAIGDFVTSTGRRLEGVGVVPDEALELDRAALAAGRDTPLEAALRWIDAERRKRR
jgi:carboxyl-terminal processing protease